MGFIVLNQSHLRAGECCENRQQLRYGYGISPKSEYLRVDLNVLVVSQLPALNVIA